MSREILIDGEKTELTKEAILSLTGMQLVEFFVRIQNEPSVLLVLNPENEALVLGLKKQIKKDERFSSEESKKVFQAVFSVAQVDNLESWFSGLNKVSDNEVHAWCDNFIEREGLPMKEESSRYNFYTEIQMMKFGLAEDIADEVMTRFVKVIADERDRRLTRGENMPIETIKGSPSEKEQQLMDASFAFVRCLPKESGEVRSSSLLGRVARMSDKQLRDRLKGLELLEKTYGHERLESSGVEEVAIRLKIFFVARGLSEGQDDGDLLR